MDIYFLNKLPNTFTIKPIYSKTLSIKDHIILPLMNNVYYFNQYKITGNCS